MSLTQYYTATTLDGFIADLDNSLDWLFTRKRDEDGLLNYGEFIADVGAMALGSTTYEWILDHEFADKDPADWKWPYDIPCWVFTHRQLPVVPDSDLPDGHRVDRAGDAGWGCASAAPSDRAAPGRAGTERRLRQRKVLGRATNLTAIRSASSDVASRRGRRARPPRC
jgi:hypothetical protein